MFGQFLDIVNDSTQNPNLLEEFHSFLDTKVDFSRLDKCLSSFIKICLTCTGSEIQLQDGVLDALGNIFERGNVHGGFPPLKNSSFKMDGMIEIQEVPFAIFEFKNLDYSIDAVLQGLQYYSIFEHTKFQYIDNFPSFIITVDRGMMFVYGATTVNGKTMCDHLISIELTACRTETNDTSNKFCRVIEALYFFYEKTTNRYLEHFKRGAMTAATETTSTPSYVDDTDRKFKELGKLMDLNPGVFFPSIFDVPSFTDPQARIPIKFESILYKGVFLVTNTEHQDKKLVLKVTSDYCLEAHIFLDKINMAPKIFGYEKVYGNFHIILMEYLDLSDGWWTLNRFYDNNKDDQFKSCSEFLTDEHFLNPLKSILDNFNKEGLFVHGDFRDRNVMARFDHESKVFHFKIIDFDASGEVGSRYTSLYFKNSAIEWPAHKFGTGSKRTIEHDTHMFEMLERNFDSCMRNIKYEKKKLSKSSSRSRSSAQKQA